MLRLFSDIFRYLLIYLLHSCGKSAAENTGIVTLYIPQIISKKNLINLNV